jgi:hypothetical protein
MSGVYLAMLTLAFGQILWAIGFQWDAVTGGSNGLTGVWPSPGWSDRSLYFGLTLALVTTGVLAMQRLLHAPLGYGLRAVRDSVLRARAIGLPVERLQWTGLVVAALWAGLAGSLYAFSKGSIAPDVLGVARSVDALVMVLLGGVQSTLGPLMGAAVFTTLQDTLARSTEFWRALLGGVILLLVLLAPQGLAGLVQQVVIHEPLGERVFAATQCRHATGKFTRLDLGRAFEQHVLEHVRHAGDAVDFVHRTHAQPKHVHRGGCTGIGLDDQGHAVVQGELLHLLRGHAGGQQHTGAPPQGSTEAPLKNRKRGFHRMAQSQTCGFAG